MTPDPTARERRRPGAAKRTARIALGLAVALGTLALSIAPRLRADHAALGLRAAEPSSPISVQPEPRREPPEVRAGLIAAIMGGFLLFVAAAGAGLFAFYRWRAVGAQFVDVRSFPAPELQTGTDGTPEPSIARQRSDLGRFRELDADHGAFQIPIEEAMRIVAARGPDAYAPVSRVTVTPPRDQ
jgi:hypothetical protein